MKKQLFILGAMVAAFVIVGCAAEQVTTNADGTKSTNYVANTTAIQAAGYAAAAAPVVGVAVPQPWGGTAAAIIAALGVLTTTVAGGIAAYKNARLNQHQTMLASVIAGVEQGNNAATKQAITNIISATPLGPKLDAIVQQVTQGITPTAAKT